MKLNLVREAAVATVIIMAITYFLNFIPFKFEFTNPIKQEFEDFDIYDLYYSGNSDIQLANDTNIIIVGVADTRAQIVEQLTKIKDLKPKVIGLDILFSRANPADITSDQALLALSQNDTIVPAYRTTDRESVDSVVAESIFPKKQLAQSGGYVNFTGENFSVVRSFQPYLKEGTGYMSSFSAKIIDKFLAGKDNSFLKRGKKIEFINYSGNVNKFITFSKQEFDRYFTEEYLRRHKNIFKGKIVLLGFFTKDKHVLDDLKFSPLNSYAKGRSYPDMYGVVIHANIIDMVLEKKPIHPLSLWASYLIASLFSFFMLYFIISRHSKTPHPGHLLFFIVQIAAVILILYLSLKLFDWFYIKFYLLPVIISLVLCVEMFEVYKSCALWLKRKFKYSTIFHQS